MKSLKVLVVSVAFYPVNSPRAFRTTELVKELCRQNHDVTLLTPYMPDTQNDLMQEYRFKIKHLPKQQLPSFLWSGKILGKLSYFTRRSLELFFEYPSSMHYFPVKKALKNESGYDLMISIAAPHSIHWGVAASQSDKHKTAKVWVADCGDPFMGAQMNKVKKPFYFKYLEKSFCQKADYITVPIESAKDAYYPEFRNKIVVIPQGFKFSDVTKNLSKYKPNTIIQFAYAGALSKGARDPRPILDALIKLGHNFKFHIYTNSPHLVQKYKEILGDKLIVKGYIPRLELIKTLSKMDFLLNLENGVSGQLPSKLIDYFLIGRPILSIDAHDFNPNDLQSFLNRDFSKKYSFKNTNQYKIENVTKNFVELTN